MYSHLTSHLNLSLSRALFFRIKGNCYVLEKAIVKLLFCYIACYKFDPAGNSAKIKKSYFVIGFLFIAIQTWCYTRLWWDSEL